MKYFFVGIKRILRVFHLKYKFIEGHDTLWFKIFKSKHKIEFSTRGMQLDINRSFMKHSKSY